VRIDPQERRRRVIAYAFRKFADYFAEGKFEAAKVAAESVIRLSGMDRKSRSGEAR